MYQRNPTTETPVPHYPRTDNMDINRPKRHYYYREENNHQSSAKKQDQLHRENDNNSEDEEGIIRVTSCQNRKKESQDEEADSPKDHPRENAATQNIPKFIITQTEGFASPGWEQEN